jgi:pilus assembly protein Flp/PilA
MVQIFGTLHLLGIKVSESVRRRVNGDLGQTAAEYLGIIVVVAIIIAAIATSPIGDNIANDIVAKIAEIFGNA